MTRLLAAIAVMVGCGCLSQQEKSEQYRLGQQHGLNLAMEMCEQAMEEQTHWLLYNPCPCLDSIVTVIRVGDSVTNMVVRYPDGTRVNFVPEVKP